MAKQESPPSATAPVAEVEIAAPAAGGDGDQVAPAADGPPAGSRRTGLVVVASAAVAAVIAGSLGLWLHSRSSGSAATRGSPAAPSSVCPTSGPDHAVGSVRGDPLLSSIFDARVCASIVATAQAGGPMTSSPAFLASVRARVLESYVFDTVTAQEARLHSALASQAQIDAEVQTDVTAAGGRDALATQLAEAGATMTTLEDETRSRLNEADLVDELARERAADVVTRLQAGLPFDQAAQQFSDDASTRAVGGVLGKVTLDQLNAADPAFKQAVLQMRAGDLSVSPIHDSQGYVVVYCDAADATSRTLRVIRIASPTPYTTKERPNWFAEFIFLDIEGDCQQSAIQVTGPGLTSPCASIGATPAPGAASPPASATATATR